MDYAVASGVFNVRRGADPQAWKAYVSETLDQLAQCGQGGFGFNMLSTASDPAKRRDDLFYAEPDATAELCARRWGGQVELKQDYGLWEFTILVRHGSQTASPIPVNPKPAPL